MLAKLKRGLHRAKQTVRRPFRRNKREKLYFYDFHVDWDGLNSFSEALGVSTHASGPLKSALDELWRCIEMFESNQHKATIRSREKYDKLGVEMNHLFRLLSKFFDESSSTTHESVAKLTRDIENETKVLQSEHLAAKQDVESGKDVQEVLGCYRRVWTLLGRFALNENTNIWKIPDENLLATHLDNLSHSPAAQYHSVESNDVRRTGCMPNTRIKVLHQLRGSVIYDVSPRIFWLNGLAGTGKTTIAYSFCEQLENAGKLAASFFCSRFLPECRDVKRILPSISYQLSSISRPFRCALSSALEDSEVHNLPISEQLVKLVAEPLLKVKHTFPANMVIVIDALDECEDDEGVDRILGILLRSTSDLPVKFFITSRPNPGILNQMRSEWGEGQLYELRLHEVDRLAVQEDIRTYLLTKLEPADLSDSNIANLVQRSGLLFIYAAAIVNYLGYDDFSQSTKRLNYVLSTPIPRANANNRGIDILYASMVQTLFDNNALEPTRWDDMTFVLHTIICAQEPLTVEVLAGLLKLEGASSVGDALLPLRSVPHWVPLDMSGLVPTLHESFANYMLDQKHSDRLYCDAKKHHARLAKACFDQINVPSPPFNICKLESSYLRDQEVPNINQRTNEAISPELLYACRYWGAHIGLAEDSEDLLDRSREFLATRLLLWMEILNLTRYMDAAASQLYRLRTWLKDIEEAAIIQDLAHDAWKFAVVFFSSPMADSTPHIYVSMLPFWPEQWPVSKHYMRGMLALPKATGLGMRKRECAALTVLSATWGDKCIAYSPDGAHVASPLKHWTVRIWNVHTGQPVGQPLDGHRGSVNSVAYSPSGAYIVSGSEDKTIRIWDAHTGQPVGQPLEGHTQPVNSVAYSPHGAYIASGSKDKTIRIWDAHTGQSVGQPLEGHTDSVRSVAFSPNGAYIVSGSSDKTIQIWETQTSQSVGQPLKGHTQPVNSVVYSPNGAYIASGSEDKTIRIWDAHAGRSVGQPLEGHTDSIRSVVFSPNGAYVASGSRDKTIRIWDAHTGQPAGQLLEDHSGSVNSIAYSPSGAYIASGSEDGTIRIWDTQTPQSIGQPFEGHTGLVSSVAYSPNGAYIASGSWDKTIRIWDAHTGQPIGQPLEGHTYWVNSVIYSPNGLYIASASYSGPIRIWDTRTEQPVGQPLEGHTDWANSIAYSPNGAYIASGSPHDPIRIWDTHTRQSVVLPLEGHAGSAHSVASSPNGAHIMPGSWDNTIGVWDADAEQPAAGPFKGHTNSVISVAYSPSGAYIASGSSDRTIRIWDARTGQSVGRPLKGHEDEVNSVTYSPNGACIASGSLDGTIRIWDAHTGQPVGQPLEGHASRVYSVAYSPNGAYIASGSLDGTIRIWDARTGQSVGQPLEGHTSLVISVAYSPNGAYIVSGSGDNTIRIWDTHWRKMVEPQAQASDFIRPVLFSGSEHLSRPAQHVTRIPQTTGQIAEYKTNRGMPNVLFSQYNMTNALFL